MTKKDLTRIEDLGSFLHEDDSVEDFSSGGDEAPPELPSFEETPSEETESAFPDFTVETTEETPNFSEGFSEEVAPENNFSDFSMPEEEAPALEIVEPTVTQMMPQEEEREVLSEVISMNDFSVPEEKPAPAPAVSDEDAYRPREDFAEVRSFVEKAVLADVSAESNPAFSVIAHGIKFLEDSEDIMIVLRELKFPEDMMEQFKRQLERGSLLVPRISEFSAIYLCHRLRRFRLELQMGPSDLLHPPREHNESASGLVSRRSLGQNHHHQFAFSDELNAQDVLISTLAHLDGHIIERYLGVATESTFLDSSKVEGEMPAAINASYDELAQKLKGHALEQRANAVVGINYQLTPMPSENPGLGHYRYKLTCTGNLVRVSRPSP